MLPAILLVDDDPTTNFLSTRLLNRLRASQEVLVALNGAAALQLLQQRCPATAGGGACPALVLLDVNMPVMGGFEFLQAYQQLPAAKRQRTIIVMLTTSMLAADRQRAEQLSVSGFLTKPLTREKLAAVFSQHFGLTLPAA